ncbi:MAG: hypothetical protein H6718_23325 [Polyangiaceae bacterium]|nr:hypothetical protein [Polyangiaceae bacterium]
MRGVLVGLGVLLTCGFASLGCSSLLGLDEFGEPENDGSSGAGGTGGAGGAGAAGGTSGTGAIGAGGNGGTGGVDPYAGCPEFFVDTATFEPNIFMFMTGYVWQTETSLGNPEKLDRLVLLTKLETVGTFDLAEEQNHRFSTCATCLELRVDDGFGPNFYAIRGTVTIDTISEEAEAPHKGSLRNAVFIEVDKQNDDEPVPDGACFRLSNLSWDFERFSYPDSTIQAITMGEVADLSRVTIRDAVVTGTIDGNAAFVQQGGGRYSGIRVGGSDFPAEVGDQVTFQGRVIIGNETDTPTVISTQTSWLISQSPHAKIPIVSVPDSSLAEKGWMGVLVRLPTPFTISQVAVDPGYFVATPDQGDPFYIARDYYDVVSDPAFPGIADGARFQSVTGLVSIGNSLQRAVFARGTEDLQGYEAPQQ